MINLVRTLAQQAQINFLFTNRVPRRFLTQLMGWYSKKESRLLTRISIFIWKIFADDLDLSEAKKHHFNSLHDCFIRELKDGVRTIDTRTNLVTSPCDAIVGTCGKINGTTIFQVKDFPYELGDLIPDKCLQEKYRDGVYVTLRLKSSMYHRFHAPVDCKVTQVIYISGDTWNVNPVALKRVEKLFCKNERAVLELETGDTNSSITLVPVASILVASIKFHFQEHRLNLKYRGPNRLNCDVNYKKGEEMGYFEHGSTIILFATGNHTLYEGITTGDRINMGHPLLIEK